MTGRFHLDTNIVSDLVRNPHGPIGARIAEVGEAAICTSIVVAAELRYGAARKASPRLTAHLDRILDAMEILPFAAPADRFYGRIRAELEQQGRIKGGNDLLIAAHCLAMDCMLVTNNESEFTRVAGLVVTNWLR